MSESTYLWLVFWDDRFVQPKRVEVREVTRLAGVTDEDLERHLIDVEIPEQERRSTRAGGVTSQLLLKVAGEHAEATGFGTAEEGVALPLGTTAIATGLNAEVVWSSDDGSSQSGPEPE